MLRKNPDSEGFSLFSAHYWISLQRLWLMPASLKTVFVSKGSYCQEWYEKNGQTAGMYAEEGSTTAEARGVGGLSMQPVPVALV